MENATRRAWRVTTGGVSFDVVGDELLLAYRIEGMRVVPCLDFGRDRIELEAGFTIQPVDVPAEAPPA